MINYFNFALTIADFMKTIIKISILFFLSACCVTANAQNPRKRLTADIYAGLNLAEMDIKDANMYKQAKIGVHIGINVNYKIIDNIQIQSGFIISKKGLKRHIHTDNTDMAGTRTVVDERYNATGNYVQVPLNLGYELYFNKLLAFNVNAGIYAAYGYKGVSTGSKVTTINDGYSDNPSVATVPEYEYETFTPDGWSRFDYGLNGAVGLIYDIYTLKVGYEYGLCNISYKSPELRNRNLYLSLGFRF
jgi:hypothetical protein